MFLVAPISKSYESFCLGRYVLFPASVVSITDWIDSPCADSPTSPSEVRSQPSAPITQEMSCSLTLRQFTGRPRYHMGPALLWRRERRLRSTNTDDILLRFIHFIPYDFDGINVHPAICVGFAAFLRLGKFTWEFWDSVTSPRLHLARKHFNLNAWGLTLILPSLKTAVATYVDIYLAPSTSPLWPVTAVRRLILQCPAPPNAPHLPALSVNSQSDISSRKSTSTSA